MLQSRYILSAFLFVGLLMGSEMLVGAEKDAQSNKKNQASQNLKQQFKSGKRIAGAAANRAGEWSQFRGPGRENKSTETGFLKSWPEGGPAVAWKFEEAGEGYSSFSFADGKLITMGNIDDKECVLAINVADGKRVWKTISTDAYEQGRGNGPRGTPTIDGDKIYALGGAGELICVMLDNGEVVWQKNILDDFEGDNIKWGISESVLIDGDKLICTPGGKKGTVVALNKNNGEVIWTSMVPGEPQAAYCSAIVINVGGVRQYVTFTSSKVVGIRADDGEPLWENSTAANRVANVSSALFHDNHIFYASNYGTGAALLQLKSANGKTEAEEIYATKKMKNHHGGMVLLDGHVYGTDQGILTCMDFSTGDVKWKERTSKGSLTYAEDMLYFRSEKGPVHLVEATTEGFNSVSEFTPEEASDYPKWTHPVVTDGKLFIRDMHELVAYDIRKK